MNNDEFKDYKIAVLHLYGDELKAQLRARDIPNNKKSEYHNSIAKLLKDMIFKSGSDYYMQYEGLEKKNENAIKIMQGVITMLITQKEEEDKDAAAGHPEPPVIGGRRRTHRRKSKKSRKSKRRHSEKSRRLK
jgi:hypothetical protein